MHFMHYMHYMQDMQVEGYAFMQEQRMVSGSRQLWDNEAMMDGLPGLPHTTYTTDAQIYRQTLDLNV